MKLLTPPNFVCFAALLLAGCGSSDSDSPTTNTTNTSSETSVTAPNPKTRKAPSVQTTRRPNERWTDENGVQYLGNVPLDVFFDQPLEVASNMTPLGGTGDLKTIQPPIGTMDSSMQPPAMTDAANSDSPTTTPVASTTNSWAEQLPAKNLLDEVNQIRSYLSSSLQSVGTYNKAMLSIPGKAACLAVLAEVALNHPEDISWKEDAAYIRDLAKKMNESDLQRGKKDQARLLLLFENITDILNRSKPAGLDEPSTDDSFSDVAEMRLLMFRMADSERRMKNEAGSESAFQSKKDMVRHEAMILGSLTKIISMEEYGYGDDPEFVGYGQNVIEACQTIRDAADTESFSAYDLALSKMSTNCNECHSAYKNN